MTLRYVYELLVVLSSILTFFNQFVNAVVGDTVTFHFQQKNHVRCYACLPCACPFLTLDINTECRSDKFQQCLPSAPRRLLPARLLDPFLPSRRG